MKKITRIHAIITKRGLAVLRTGRLYYDSYDIVTNSHKAHLQQAQTDADRQTERQTDARGKAIKRTEPSCL